MAGSQKEFELLFKLRASLGGDFNNTFKTAIDTQNKLRDSLKNVNSLQSKIDGYTKQVSAIDKNKEKLRQLTEEHDRLQQEMSETEEPSEALRRRLQRNESQIQQTTARIEEQENRLNSLGNELRDAGIDTDNLEGANQRLQRSYERLNQSQQNLQRLNAEQEKIKQSISTTKTQLLGTVGTITAIGAAIYAGPVQAAMSFESNMAEVSKVVDWLKDDTGALTKEYGELKQEILTLTTQIPMTAQEITEIMAAAGQANVAMNNDELVQFTESAAKMGIAFDTTSEQAGEWMAQWRTSFKMSQQEVIELSDKINYLGNTSAANAQQISTIVTKIGPLGDVAGLASGEIAALGATLVATGVNEDVAATGIKNLMLAMVSGESITKKQAGVLKSLGINATDLSERMQTDATGAILDFLKAVKKLPEAEQAAALKNYFGKESVSAIAPLLTNLDYLEEQFLKVGDASQYAGSMEAEYAARADTTENKVQLAKNSLQKLCIVLGDTFLPVVGAAAEKLSAIVTKVADFAQANPELVKTVVKVATALAGLKVAGLVGKLGFLEMKSGINTVKIVMEALKGKMAILQASSIGLGSKLASAGSGILGYFKGIGTAAGGVFGSITRAFSNSSLFSALSGVGARIVSAITSPFSLLGGRLSGILSGLGGIIARSPLGRIGSFVAAGFSRVGAFITPIFGKITAVLAPVGNLLKSIFAPLAKLGTSLLGPLGGIVGKIMPVVGVVTLVITAFQLVRKHLDKIREVIGNVFGEKGLEVFDKIVAVVTNVGNAIKNVFSDGNIGAARDKIQEIFGEKGVAIFDKFAGVFQTIVSAAGQFVDFVTTHIVPVAEQILSVIITSVIPGIINAVQTAAPFIMSIIQSIADFIGAVIPIIGGFIAGIMPVISEIITFIQTYVFPIIQEVFNFIVGTVFPMIKAGIEAILPIITNILSTLLPFIQTAVTTIWNIVQPIIQGILAAIQFVMPTIQAIIQNVIGTITGIIQGLITILSGVITFITGVFSGNWSQAWEGIKTIFSGIWEGIKSICKGVINGIITAVNTIIRGLNKLKVPDWVPGIGGKGINISEIPMLAKGSKNTPDTFIAGEEGPELITNSPGRTVYTAEQTKSILQSQNAAVKAAETVQGVPQVSSVVQSQPQSVNAAPEVAKTAGQSGGGNNITLNNNPTIIVDGEKPDDLEEKLKRNNEELLQQVEDLLDKKDDDERRSKYE